MIYLASPYSHPDGAIRKQRFRDACLAAVRLLELRLTVFSPIIHGHPLVAHGLPTDWSHSERFDRDHIQRCDSLVVLMLDGWQESVGVTAEIRIAAELGRSIGYWNPTEPPTIAHVATEGGS